MARKLIQTALQLPFNRNMFKEFPRPADSAPMVQNVNLVDQREIGRLQLLNRAHDATVCHIAARIIF
jgi:hypothetical protein